MKKLITLSLLLALCIGLIACNGGSASKPGEETTPPPTEEATDPTSTPEGDDTSNNGSIELADHTVRFALHSVNPPHGWRSQTAGTDSLYRSPEFESCFYADGYTMGKTILCDSLDVVVETCQESIVAGLGSKMQTVFDRRKLEQKVETSEKVTRGDYEMLKVTGTFEDGTTKYDYFAYYVIAPPDESWGRDEPYPIYFMTMTRNEDLLDDMEALLDDIADTLVYNY